MQTHAVGLQTEESGIILDAVLDAIAVKEAVEEELLQPVNALSGADHSRTILLRALIENQVVLLLLDSESTHSFIDVASLSRIQT